MSIKLIEAKFITLNFMGGGILCSLKEFLLGEERRPAQTQVPGEVVKTQLWQNAINVSAGIVTRALSNHDFAVSDAYYTVRAQDQWQRHFKVVFKSRVYLAENPPMQLTDAQRAEIRMILGLTFKYCHGLYYPTPIPNVQVAFLNRTTEHTVRQLTVRNGELVNVSTEDLSEDERIKDVTRGFASRLTGR